MTWHCKASGAYSRTSQEAIDNATEIYSALYKRGWTVNAVAGLLGNIGAESGYNPWRWQSDHIGTSGGSPWTDRGYGLTQFTPAGKYIDDSAAIAAPGYGPNFSDRSGKVTDGNAQMIFLDGYADYYPTGAYPMTYAEYKQSTDDAGKLAVTWLYNYERPKDPAATADARRENGLYWFDVLGGISPAKNTALYLLYLWEVTHNVR